jgi:hypothetical protein
LFFIIQHDFFKNTAVFRVLGETERDSSVI